MKRPGLLSRGSAIQRKTRIKSSNPERQAKRRKRFKAYLSSPAWKAKRRAVFERDGYRCTAEVLGAAIDFIGELHTLYGRCPFTDESRTGKGLVCNHKTYARFGHENLDDLETLCRAHDRQGTAKHRANHFNGYKNGQRRTA